MRCQLIDVRVYLRISVLLLTGVLGSVDAAAYTEEYLSDEKNTIEVFQQSSPKVVYVHRLNSKQAGPFSGKNARGSSGSGSGIVWDRQGHIVTNFHVVHGAKALSVTLGGLTVAAKVVGTEPRRDIAVLKLSSTAALDKIRLLSPFELKKSNELMVGQKAIAIGNPYGLDHSLTVGVISALKRKVPGVGGVTIHDMIQTDASVNPGNSGGPLLDSHARLVGMNTAIFSNSGSSVGIGFAVSADDLQSIVPQLIQYGRVKFAGIGIQRADPNLAYKKGIQKGVLIGQVLPKTPAAKAGLRGTFRDHWGRLHLGDVVTRVNGHAIRSYDDLYHQLVGVKVGDSIRLTVNREGKLIENKIKTIDIAAY